MSSSTSKKINKAKTKKSKRKRGIFMKNVLSRRVILPFHSVGSNIRENIKNGTARAAYRGLVGFHACGQ